MGKSWKIKVDNVIFKWHTVLCAARTSGSVGARFCWMQAFLVLDVTPQGYCVTGARIKPMLQSASSTTPNGYAGGPFGSLQLESVTAVGGMSHRRSHPPDTNQNNHVSPSMGTTTVAGGQPIINHKDVATENSAPASKAALGDSSMALNSSMRMKKSHSSERKKVAEAFIMTGDAIIITKSLESSTDVGFEETKEVKSSPEDEEHSAASRMTLSKHTNATTGECTSELVSAFGSEELGAGYSDFDISTANTISPSEDFSREEDWLEPDLSEAHLRNPVLDCQAVTTGSSWQRHSMDESSLSFYKEETFSEERRVVSTNSCGGNGAGSWGSGGSSCGARVTSCCAEDVSCPSQNTASEKEKQPQKPPTPPPPPLPTVSPPASPEEVPVTSTPIFGISSDLPHLVPLGLPPLALARTSVDVPSALRLAKRLFNLEGFKKIDVSHHLSKNNDFSRCVAEEYLRNFDFSGLSLDAALRHFLDKFCLQGETQERERVLAHFSKRFLDCNPQSSEQLGSQDAVHTLTCALMLLNTDLHGNGMSRRRMTAQDFAQNLSGLNDGKDFPKEMLRILFQAIKDQPIKWATENESTPPHRGGESPFSGAKGSAGVAGATGAEGAHQQQQQQRNFRKGYLIRKCCVDPGGRRTPRGKRGWRPLYAKLSDLLLLLHKDEKSCDEMRSLTDSMQHTTPIHHCLATIACDYTKRPWVFRLQTADLAEFLFQAVSDQDCLAWVDTINCVAATLSAPALPAPTSNTAKFQRPTLPISHTRLKPQEQLESHYARVLCLEREVYECKVPGSSPAHQNTAGTTANRYSISGANSGTTIVVSGDSSSNSGGMTHSCQSSPLGNEAASERRKEKDKEKERTGRNAAKEAFLQYELKRYNTYATILANAIRQ
ncbi:PH and SEC7 domain-containing protein 1-like, partial [Tropilaelaps mercedesae]